MSAFIEQKDRTLIPRWRTFCTTVALGELESRLDGFSPTETADFLSEKFADWRKFATVWHATDLLSSAIAVNRETEVKEVAQFILQPNSGATDSARAAAAAIAASDPRTVDLIPFSPDNDFAHIYRAIHTLRLQTAEQSDNSILWVDLALAYTILGLIEQAERAIRIALKYSPTNRFVLRSSARFYIHVGELGVAHSILSKAESTPYDPWLMAAEIAAASAAKLRPIFVKPAKIMLANSSVRPRDLSELAGSVGTVELENGSHGPARKFFKSALVAPNENSVAQVEWASNKIKGLPVDPAAISVPRLFEARAWDAFASGDWKTALSNAKLWLQDQPFSSRPALLAAYISEEVFEDFKSANRILENSSKANPDDVILRNDLAYCYARQNLVDEAASVLNSLNATALANPIKILVLATGGLIEFRSGRIDRGRELYAEAIGLAKRADLSAHEAGATINLAREEIRISSPLAATALRTAQDAVSKFPRKDFLLMIDQIGKTIAVNK